MSPTIFREGPFRFLFFSREEPRMHVHVQSKNYNLSSKDLRKIRELIDEHEKEIRDAWHSHFGS